MNKSDKIRRHFSRFPGADVKATALKFHAPISMVYKLRKEVVGVRVKDQGPEAADIPTNTITLMNTDEEEIVSTLTDRGEQYGRYKGHAQVTQSIKRIMADHARANNKTFTDTQWESLEMIAHKIGRIVNGNPEHRDSWLDIAGYAQLVADELVGIER
jgi:hypothetical protein